MSTFISHQVLTRKDSPLSYLLLQCIRTFQILDMYLILEVHTEATIAAGRRELANLAKIIQVCFHYYYYYYY